MSNRASFVRNNDLVLLRGSLLRFGIVAALSGMLAAGSGAIANRQLEQKRLAQAARGEALAKLREAETEKQEINQFQPKYVVLQKRGLVGEEDRLSMIETLRTSQQKRALLPVAYEFGAQRIFAVDAAVPLGNLQLRGSEIRLRMKLWHEMDLFDLLEDLAGKGLQVPTECMLTRTPLTPENPSPTGLEAACRLQWLTLGTAREGNASTGAAQ